MTIKETFILKCTALLEELNEQVKLIFLQQHLNRYVLIHTSIDKGIYH